MVRVGRRQLARLLQLAFGGDPKRLAVAQREVHAERLREHEELHTQPSEWPEGLRLALESGIDHECEWVRFWEWVAGGVSRAATARGASSPPPAHCDTALEACRAACPERVDLPRQLSEDGR